MVEAGPTALAAKWLSRVAYIVETWYSMTVFLFITGRTSRFLKKVSRHPLCFHNKAMIMINSVQESSDIGRTFIHPLCNFQVECGTSQREESCSTCRLFLVCSRSKLSSQLLWCRLSTAAHSSPGTVFHTWPEPLATALLVNAWSEAIAHSFHRCHSRLAWHLS